MKEFVKMASLNYSAQDQSVALGLLGWSRGGKIDHFPEDMIREISQYVYFDIRDSRAEVYREHKKNMLKRKMDYEHMKYRVIYPLIDGINRNMRVHYYGEYEIQSSPIMVDSNCCMRCGEFMSNDVVCERARCKCLWYSDDEIEQMEYENDEYYEEDMEERRIKELKARKKEKLFINIETESNFDDDYYDRDDYDDYSYDDYSYDDSYDESQEYTHIEYDDSGDYY